MKKTIRFSVDEEVFARVAELALKNHGGSASEFARHATFRAIGQYKGRPSKKEVEEVVISGADGHSDVNTEAQN